MSPKQVVLSDGRESAPADRVTTHPMVRYRGDVTRILRVVRNPSICNVDCRIWPTDRPDLARFTDGSASVRLNAETSKPVASSVCGNQSSRFLIPCARVGDHPA